MRTRSSFGALALTFVAALAVATACVPPNPPAPPPPAAGTCLDGSGVLLDLRYDGPIDTVGNATVHDTTDGSCDDDAPATATMIRSTTGGQSAANQRCQDRGDGFGPALRLRTNGYSKAPSNLYLCEGSLVQPPSGEIEPGTCFDAIEGGQDVRYDGPDDGSPNVSVLGSTDGSCSGDVQFQGTMVFADDESAAGALCEARGTGYGPPSAPPPDTYEPDLPPRAWLCLGSVVTPLGDPPEVGDCYDGISSNDISYLGGLEDLGNVAFHSSTDGTCADPPTATVTAVWAATQAEAGTLCEARRVTAGAPEDPAWTAFPLSAGGFPTAPNGLYMCNGSFGPPPPPPVTECYPSDGVNVDVGLAGPIDTFGNTLLFGDGSNCQVGPFTGGFTMVEADDPGAALTLCQAVAEWSTSAFQLSTSGYSTAPANRYICQPQAAP